MNEKQKKLRFSMSDLLIFNLLKKSKSYFGGFTKIYHAVSCYSSGKQIIRHVF